MNSRYVAVTTAILALTAICGCRVDSHKDGENENVKVATPFGGIQVKTNEAASDTGLPIYPGSTLVKKDKNSGSADVNLSFGRFQLRVKAASYTTPDAPEKVNAFYRDAMKRFGTVIECNHDQPVGTPTQTDQGLTCSDSDKHGHVNVDTDTDSSKTELKTGSKQHQRIVAIDPEGSGTKFGLVQLDLPGGLSVNDSDARQ
jgi:hypothetical protein